MKQRDVTYDLMKAIAIILMMLSHLVYNDGMPKQIIYSFHMPLFFIIAGIFAKDIADIPSFKDLTKKSAKRLLLPYVVTMLMLCTWGGIQAIAKHDISFFLRHLFSMLTASADGWETKWGLIYAGPMWFLVALYWVREIFYGIRCACMNVSKFGNELVVGISLILSVASVLIHPYLPALPFCFMPAFTGIAFYAVGWYIHRYPMPWWVYGMCVMVWPISIMYGGVDVASCQLDYYPLSFIGACGGTYVVYLLCKSWARLIDSLISRHTTLNIITPITWCGIYSLPILCMHTFEMHSDMYYSIMCRMSVCCERVWGGVIAILFAYIITKTPILKDVYK